jgi:hypothetical protein
MISFSLECEDVHDSCPVNFLWQLIAHKVFTMPVWSWLLDRSVVNLPHGHFHQILCCFRKCCSCSPVPFLCILRGCHIGHHQIECSVALWRNVVSLWDFIPSPKYPIFGAPHFIPSLLPKTLCLGAYLGRPKAMTQVLFCQILRCPKLITFLVWCPIKEDHHQSKRSLWVHSQLTKPLNAW